MELILFNLGDVDSNVVEGVTVAYGTDAFTIGASFENVLTLTPKKMITWKSQLLTPVLKMLPRSWLLLRQPS